MSNVKAPPAPASSATAVKEKQTLVEDGTRFKGSLTSTCAILVQGAVEGDVEGPAVTVSATGAVSGKIATGALKSEGKIAGEFDVESAQVSGSVESNTVIRAASLDLKLNASSGKMQLTFGSARDGRRS